MIFDIGSSLTTMYGTDFVEQGRYRKRKGIIEVLMHNFCCFICIQIRKFQNTKFVE